MVEVRCCSCGKLLGWFDGKGQIKCPRSGCGGMNVFDTGKNEKKIVQKHVTLDERTSGGVIFR